MPAFVHVTVTIGTLVDIACLAAHIISNSITETHITNSTTESSSITIMVVRTCLHDEDGVVFFKLLLTEFFFQLRDNLLSLVVFLDLFVHEVLLLSELFFPTSRSLVYTCVSPRHSRSLVQSCACLASPLHSLAS
jgi:hypothetical protein